MPGKLRRKSPHGQSKAGPPPPTQGPVSNTVRRATNLNRVKKRVLRRQATQQSANANAIQNRPRPAVKPVQPPRRVMPDNQPPVRHNVAYRRPAAPAKSPMSPGPRPIAAAGAASLSALILNVSRAHTEISLEVNSLQRDLEDLKETSTLAEVSSDMASLDSALNHAVSLLESARDKGYRYQHDLEEMVSQAMSRLEIVRPKVHTGVEQHSQQLQSQLQSLIPQVNRLNAVLPNARAATPVLRTTHSQINELLREAERVQRNLENHYNEIKSQIHELNRRLTEIHWALEQLDTAKFNMETGEDLVMAVPTRWDQESKDDPEGVLYLSNKRLIFERKEKVATKKVLFITTASELIHEVLIDQPLSGISSFQAANKGLFGHHDYLEVAFEDPNLGPVAFHLDGQDSTYWAKLLDESKSGMIDGQRVLSAGLTLVDLSKPITKGDLIDLQNEVHKLQDELMLGDVRKDLAALENQVSSLERNLARVRARGYALERNLEADVAVLKTQWERVKINAEIVLEQQTTLLAGQTGNIQKLLAQMASRSSNLAAVKPIYMQIKSAVASAEAQADAAESTVMAQYDAYAEEVDSLAAHLSWIDWMLEALATASFRLLASESGVAAAEALWAAPGLQAENGILFLTDQRLLWEDRVGTYELKLDVPLEQVVTVRKESAGEGGHEGLIFTFGPGSPLESACFQMALPIADSWPEMVGRARSGCYMQDRAIPIDEGELQRIRNAPQQCPTCGAAFTSPILRGQTEIACEYCGVKVKI